MHAKPINTNADKIMIVFFKCLFLVRLYVRRDWFLIVTWNPPIIIGIGEVKYVGISYKCEANVVRSFNFITGS
jgi:hypothetical protein